MLLWLKSQPPWLCPWPLLFLPFYIPYEVFFSSMGTLAATSCGRYVFLSLFACSLWFLGDCAKLLWLKSPAPLVISLALTILAILPYDVFFFFFFPSMGTLAATSSGRYMNYVFLSWLACSLQFFNGNTELQVLWSQPPWLSPWPLLFLPFYHMMSFFFYGNISCHF